MGKYLYETHMHTAEVSACASTTGKQQARIYKELGYDGIIITDHFANGNSRIARHLPWDEWVNRFVSGYENAKEEGNKIGLSVFFGWEESFEGNDFLVYGLDKQWLLDNPDAVNWSIEKTYQHVKEAGGYFVHAHPYREAEYIKKIRLFPKHVDAVEVINSSHLNFSYDKKASNYASKHKLSVISGSDSHHDRDIRGGMAFNHKLEDIHDFIDTLESDDENYLFRNVNEL